MDVGVGVSPVTAVTAFQPFFLSFTLPYSAVRGEVVPVLVTIFNYMSECLVVSQCNNMSECLLVSQNNMSECFMVTQNNNM